MNQILLENIENGKYRRLLQFVSLVIESSEKRELLYLYVHIDCHIRKFTEIETLSTLVCDFVFSGA